MKNDTAPVLSIFMLTSGKKDMRKSLECLQYFKRSLSCEVILVDTGCNEEQRSLIEAYGDKIVDFVWCNDFAAARNAGLKEAGGEWFLYLDDDEWFEDPQEIISFFQTGEYKKFNSAEYVVRNYLDFEGIRYTDAYLTRLVKLEPETRFEGKIHEYLTPVREPKKCLADIAQHYGYAFQNETERENHARRNREPLLEMRKRCPGDARWIAQLAQEYLSGGEYEKTFEVCRIGLDECRQKGGYGEKYVGTFYGDIFAFILISLECMEKFEAEELWLNEAMSQSFTRLEVMEPTVAYYCFLGARLFCITKRYEISRDYLRKYIDYTYKLRYNREAIARGAVLVTADVFQPHTVNGTLMCVEGLIRLEDYAFAEESFYLLDWRDKKLLHQDIWERNILDACCSVAYHPLWVRMLQTLCSREEGMKEMLVVFLDREVAYKTDREEEKLSRLYRLVAELSYEHRYILCTRILWAAQDSEIRSQEERKEKLLILFRRLFEKYPHEIFEIRNEIWDAAEQNGISLGNQLEEMDYRVWKQCLEVWCREASLTELRKWDERAESWGTEAGIRSKLFRVKRLEGLLRCCVESRYDLAELEELLWKYSAAVLDLYGPYYKEAVLEEIPENLQEDIQLALRLKRLQPYREQGDVRGTLEHIKKCLGIYPALEPVILEYAEAIRDEARMQNSERNTAQAELSNLVSALKAAARQRIAAAEYQAAREILLQVEQCVPEDEEVRELLAEAEKGICQK
ncbi:MAG: glycosyltransferase [Ruminococcus flavefaciens]|nr:glycosyltransferase [Ruminococcus flavefaciens]